MRHLIIILSLSIIFRGSILATSSNGAWQTYTSMFQVMDLTSDDDHIWCGTKGGLLAFDPVTQVFVGWTNTEGLASIQVTAVQSDMQGGIWIGFENGLLQRYNPISSEWSLIDDFQGNTISCFAVMGDTLFVGLDIGVSLYLISRREVKETYHNLGFQSQTGHYLTDIPVNDILLFENTIWAATDEGIALASLDNRNLLDPSSWTQWTEENGLTDHHVSALASGDDRVYAGTENGIFEWINQTWHFTYEAAVYDLTLHDQQMHAATQRGVVFKTGEAWQSLKPCPYIITSLRSGFSSLWAGTEKGLYHYIESEWIGFIPDTPPSSLISDISVEDTGHLWCSSRNSGFFRYDGNHWTLYDRNTVTDLQTDNFVTTLVDRSENKWFGSWGYGLVCLRSDNTFQFFNAENGYLAGVSENPQYAVVHDMALDPDGTIWLLNYRSVTNQPLVAITPDAEWIYYGLADNVSSVFLRVISVDQEGRKWIGTYSDGIFVLDDNGTPKDKSDDPAIGRLTTDDGLETNEISAIATDSDGGVWIGTPKGLYYYFLGILSRRYGMPSENITALTVDGANNIWIGTHDGLIMFSEATYQSILYTQENSGLANNEINTLAMDQESGMLYIGTGNGLSSLQTPFSKPRSELSEIHVYPNPFIPKEHDRMVIDELAQDVSVHIYSPGGFLVRRFSQDEIHGRRLLWDGINQTGESISGGIYLIVVSTESGERRIGKVAVVR